MPFLATSPLYRYCSLRRLWASEAFSWPYAPVVCFPTGDFVRVSQKHIVSGGAQSPLPARCGRCIWFRQKLRVRRSSHSDCVNRAPEFQVKSEETEDLKGLYFRNDGRGEYLALLGDLVKGRVQSIGVVLLCFRESARRISGCIIYSFIYAVKRPNEQL